MLSKFRQHNTTIPMVKLEKLSGRWYISEKYDLEFKINNSSKLGEMGEVYKGTFNRMDVACKVFSKSCQVFSKSVTKTFQIELFQWSAIQDSINHINCLQCMAYTSDIWVMVSKYQPYDLRKLLGAGNEIFLSERGKCLQQLIKFLKDLHTFDKNKPLIYRDVKPDNILLDNHYNVIVTDFGTLRLMQTTMTSNIGTWIYMAPEVKSSSHYTTKADIYSLGVLWIALILKGDSELQCIENMHEWVENNSSRLKADWFEIEGLDLYDLRNMVHNTGIIRPSSTKLNDQIT